MKKTLLVAPIIFSILTISCNDNTPENTGGGETPITQTPVITYSVAGTLPHDTSFYLEGLEFYKGNLIESTGQYEKSKLVEYDPATGIPVKQVPLDAKYFGEGATIFRDTVYQLTYREGIVHVYNVKDFKKIKELPYTQGEGWGLTHDSTYLIATNSGNSLYYFEPGTFKFVKSIAITENGLPAFKINELEYINGFIYANQFELDYILKIDPVKGEVVAKMDLSSIRQQEKSTNPNAEVLNGIAYNPQTKKFYVTGKNWSKIYELQLAL